MADIELEVTEREETTHTVDCKVCGKPVVLPRRVFAHDDECAQPDNCQKAQAKPIREYPPDAIPTEAEIKPATG